MFAGIVETTATVSGAFSAGTLIRINVERPKAYTDLRVGDSISVDGVCLTLEELDADNMLFALTAETLKITGWTLDEIRYRVMNLERSLRLEARVHGHLVTGHVDTNAQISEIVHQSEAQKVTLKMAPAFNAFIWPKGSVAINGVSLTLNETADGTFCVTLIPETLKRTNLGKLSVGDRVNLEVDNMARGLVNWARIREAEST